MKYQNTQKDTWNENLHIFLCQLIKTCFVLSDKKIASFDIFQNTSSQIGFSFLFEYIGERVSIYTEISILDMVSADFQCFYFFQ